MSAPFNEFGPFAVGEICMIVHCVSFPELIGREVMITGPCQMWIDARTGEPYDGYRTDLIYKDAPISPPESYLRRRKPPAAGSNERTFMQKCRDMDKAPQRVEVPA